ncbi:MAG TPA: hypothetical protein VFO44_02205 [Steroidobacteraceae bacterium]|nr:hypothetical protein [Steroidobacteraceae bacterium]
MLIRKKMPRPHAAGEPLLHEDHPKPVTRRQMLAAGLMSAPAVVMAPAWLAALLKPGKANAALAADMQALLQASQCNLSAPASGVPVVCFDLAGGANLIGSEVIVGLKGGQANFLSTAAYGKMGVPGNMVPTANSAFVSSALGLLWHSDGAILRGILTKATTPATALGTNGAVIAAMSQNDTNTNPHNPMYGIAEAGGKGTLLNLIGTQSTVSGGNSAAPMYMIQPSLQPTKIAGPGDATALVSTGGASADPVDVAVLQSQARISGGSTLYDPSNTGGTEFTGVLSPPQGATPGTLLYPTDASADVQLKNQLRCAYVQSANTADVFGSPAALDPTQDPLITGGATPIFTMSDFQDNDIAATASVMKLVLDGFAAAGTITLGGYDYHDSTRATGETRNFKAGQMIGAVLEYAQRKKAPVMIYVFSDGSLTSSSMVDTSTAGRDKLAWQGDNQSVASTFFLVYSPKGRPVPRNGAASQQIGWYTSDGAVDPTSNPAANSVTQLVETVVLNYLGLQGKDGMFSSLFPTQGLGSASAQAALTAFQPII